MNQLFKNRHDKLLFFKNTRKQNLENIRNEVNKIVFETCPNCNHEIPSMELIDNLTVCPKCNYHFKITAKERIYQILDSKSFNEIDKNKKSNNEDNFVGYTEKLEKYRKDTGLSEAVICGTGKIDGMKVAIAVMDSYFMMGSMGAVVGEKITRLVELATKKKLPLIIVCTSGGARMQEGIISLMQMAKTSAAIKRFSDLGGLYISILTNPTTGGVSASFAMLGDIIIAEPGALIGFAGKRVIEKTINEVLPKEFQTAEFVKEKGFVDLIVDRKDLKETLSDLIYLHGGNK